MKDNFIKKFEERTLIVNEILNQEGSYSNDPKKDRFITKLKERNVIAEHLLEREIKYRNDPKNAEKVALQEAFYDELNSLGYDFFWRWQFSGNPFTIKDKEVVPIVIKHLRKFNEIMKSTYLYCLGVKGFYEATQYLIEEYQSALLPKLNLNHLNLVSQTLAKIQDPKYIDKYLEFLEDRYVVANSCFLVEMLGKMKVEKAIPRIIELLDGERKIRESAYGSVLEDYKYAVSHYAITALSKFKNQEHIKYIEKFLEPEKIEWIKFTEGSEQKSNYKKTYKKYRQITEKAIKRMKGELR